MIKKWKRGPKEIMYQAHIMRHCRVPASSQTTTKKALFDVVECVDWVNVLAITKDQKVIMVRQYRPGRDCVTLELPGGAVNPNEDPMIGAQRELEEETGGVSKLWSKLGCSEVNPAFMENSCHYYLAQDVELNKQQSLDPQEEIEVLTIPLNQIPDMIKNGEINHALNHAAFYFYWMLKQKVF